jgi:heat shock protein HslJ
MNKPVVVGMMRVLCLVLVLGGSLMSGAPNPSSAAELAADAAAEPMSLAGSEWGFPEETAEPKRSVQFDGQGNVSGSGGCNRFGGTYQQQGTSLKIGQLRTTLMACLDESLMQRERDFLQLLAATTGVDASHLVLKLYAAEGQLLVLLHRRDFD